MDLSITSTKAVDKVAAAVAEVARALEADHSADLATRGAVAQSAAPGADAATALVRGGFVERVLGEVQATVAAVPQEPPVERIDRGPETANMQTFARPHAPVAEALPPADKALPTDQHARSEFAVPASMLVPATLIGLQVDPATLWPMTARGFDPETRPLHDARVRERDPQPQPEPEHTEGKDDAEHEASDKSDTGTPADAADATTVEESTDHAWREPLTSALRHALEAALPPESLRAAAEQWQRGRAVVLVCPQAGEAHGRAWAFVLAPGKTPSIRRDGTAAPLQLHGERVEARLLWAPSLAARWCHTRVIKQHHPRTGRQLIPNTPGATGRVPCEVQLGPVLARALRPCDVCVRIDAVRRFWAALGTQWSMLVVVAPAALAEGDGMQEVPR